MIKKKKEEGEKVTGKVSLKDIQGAINKSVGYEVATNLNERDATKVDEWISTGSKVFDGTIATGMWGGIPKGRVTELAGLSSTGKSLMACQIAVNAQKQDYDVVYFDTERGIGKEFLAKMGCDFEQMLYVVPSCCEELFEIMEKCLMTAGPENKFLFIWDSFAMTPTRELKESEGVDPKMHGMRRALVVSNAWTKFLIPFNKANATMIIANHLRINTKMDTRNTHPTIEQMYQTPGGSTLTYIYDQRLWLVNPRTKKSYLYYGTDGDGNTVISDKDDKAGWRVGSTVRAKILKSRHGAEGRECEFKVIWNDAEHVGIREEENICDIVSKSDDYTAAAWHSLKLGPNEADTMRFRKSEFPKLFNTNKIFHDKIMELLEDELIIKFQKKVGNAQDFYGAPYEETPENLKKEED